MINKSIKIGERSPEFKLRTLDAQDISIGEVDLAGRSTLVMFVAPECPVCAKLLPALKSIGTQEAKHLRLVFASDGDVETQQKFWRAKGLSEFPYVLSQELGTTYQIGRLPYGVLIDANGVMVAHGLCNSREHVESLFEAQRHGVGSLQDYLQRQEQRAEIESVN
jgi:methylamine dehydrogenase accessory protein MauD